LSGRNAAFLRRLSSCVVCAARRRQQPARDVGQRGIGNRRSRRLDVTAVVVVERLRATLATLGRRRGLGREGSEGEAKGSDDVELRAQPLRQLGRAQRQLVQPW